MRKKTLSLLFLIILFALPALTHAAEDKCGFKKSVLDLQLLKGAESSDLVEEKELETRKAALASILECLINSTDKVYENLENSPLVPKAVNLRTRFKNELWGNNFFYKEKLKEIENMDIKESKTMAKEILTWKKNHTEDIDRASQFIIWSHNQELLSKASRRVAQISSLSLIKPGSSFAKNLEKAKSYLGDAEKINSTAQESFERSSPTTESMGYIKGSLESLQNAYKSFLKLGF